MQHQRGGWMFPPPLHLLVDVQVAAGRADWQRHPLQFSNSVNVAVAAAAADAAAAQHSAIQLLEAYSQRRNRSAAQPYSGHGERPRVGGMSFVSTPPPRQLSPTFWEGPVDRKEGGTIAPDTSSGADPGARHQQHDDDDIVDARDRVGSASAGTQLEAADVGVTEESVQHDIAALHHPETGEEVRVDPADGHLHTMSGFIDFYGRSAGMQRWVDAPRTLEELAFVSAEADSSMALGDDPSAVGNSHGEELTFSVSELKEMMAGGMSSSGKTGEIDPETGEEMEYVLLLTDAWRERFAESEQMRWRKKGAFDFNRPKKHPVNKSATRERHKQQKQRGKEFRRKEREFSRHRVQSDVARRTKQLEAEMALGPGGAARWERIQELGASLNVRFDSFIAENHPSFWPEMPLAM